MMAEKTLTQIWPLIKMPPSEWKIRDGSAEYFWISVYYKNFDGQLVRHWQRWSIHDFPNDLFGIEDLENAGLLHRYVAAVQEQILGPAGLPADMAANISEGDKMGPQDNGI